MPITGREDITGYAHCTNPRCEGRSQTEVKAVRETVGRTFADSGGDLPGVEKSQVYFHFTDPEDATCAHCGAPREVTDQQRVVYENLSGKAQDGLLQYKPVGV